MKSDTPEFDKAYHECLDDAGQITRLEPLYECAKKLERERDGARHDRDLYHETANREHAERVKAEAERDQLRKVCDELAYCLKSPTIFQRQESIDAVQSYNQLPHAKDKTK